MPAGTDKKILLDFSLFKIHSGSALKAMVGRMFDPPGLDD